MNRRDFFKCALGMVGAGALVGSAEQAEQPVTLTYAEVRDGLCGPIEYLPNGDSLALIGDTWYRDTGDRAEWKAIDRDLGWALHYENEIAVVAYMRRKRWEQV